MKPILIFVMTAFIGIASMAQQNFSGNWNIKEKKHVSGPEYANGAPASFTVQQTKDSIIIVYPENNSRVVFATNGKTSTSTGKETGRKIIRTLKWSDDKKSVTFTSDICKSGNDKEIELTRIDRWELTPDGKQLQFNRRSVETITESWEVNAVFEKQ